MTRPAETGADAPDLPRNGAAAPPATGPVAATQPITPPEPTRRLGITTTQVGATAAASVTSALGASFLGAAGTVAGAAVGSIISTVAGAIYARSLETAGTKLRQTTVRVTQVSNEGARRPGSVPTHLADVDEPPATAVDADVETTVLAPSGAEADAAATPPPGAPPTADRAAAPGDGAGGRPGIRRKPLLVTAGVAVAGFGLALGGISVAEGLLGHPVSGGSGGTSIGRVVSNDTSTQEDEETSEPSVSPTGESDPPLTDEPTGDPADESSPTAEPTDESNESPTTDPSQEPADEQTQAPEEQSSP